MKTRSTSCHPVCLKWAWSQWRLKFRSSHSLRWRPLTLNKTFGIRRTLRKRRKLSSFSTTNKTKSWEDHLCCRKLRQNQSKFLRLLSKMRELFLKEKDSKVQVPSVWKYTRKQKTNKYHLASPKSPPRAAAAAKLTSFKNHLPSQK